MQVTRTSIYSSKTRTLDLDITAAQLAELNDPHRERLIQDIVPQLSNEHREFLLTGMTQEEWDAVFN